MLNSWYQKFDKLSKNYKEEITNFVKSKSKLQKISNHIIYNYSGRTFSLNFENDNNNNIREKVENGKIE